MVLYHRVYHTFITIFGPFITIFGPMSSVGTFSFPDRTILQQFFKHVEQERMHYRLQIVKKGTILVKLYAQIIL